MLFYQITVKFMVSIGGNVDIDLFKLTFFYRYQYYLQLKKDILEGNIPCTLEQAIQLAGLAVQGK